MVNAESGEPKREFVGFVRIAGHPDIQLRLMASSASEAWATVTEEYGEGHVISVWNEEDARRLR
ncbi:hypothetical protein ACWCQL_39135 [Streptomyces sp. NPDC002073]